MGKTKKKKKTKLQKFTSVIKVFTILGIIAWGAVFAFNYAVGDEATTKDASGDVVDSYTKKEELNVLFCGINEVLTDTMMYIKYNVKTGKIAMISIPRDTYVNNEYCIGHKLNAIYRKENIVPLVEEIEGMLDVNIDYYVVVDNDIVKDLVDAIGGVEIEVPMRMKYDDPTQDLHIDLQKGVQVLDGDKAEQFIRFRKNNDGTGYAMGDIQRVEVQHTFIKAFISTMLSTKNITKIPDLLEIALKNTDTNITLRDALKYSSDAVNIDVDSLETYTAEGEAKMIDGLSYFLLDKEETQQLIKQKFVLDGSDTTITSVTSEDNN